MSKTPKTGLDGLLRPDGTLMLSWNGLWKHARQDAFYAPPLAPVPGTASSSGRSIGSQTSISLQWELPSDFDIGATYVDLRARDVTRDAGGSSGRFFAVWISKEIPLVGKDW